MQAPIFAKTVFVSVTIDNKENKISIHSCVYLKAERALNPLSEITDLAKSIKRRFFTGLCCLID